MSITSDEDVLHGLPRLEGTRISVIHVYNMVIGGDSTPADVASELDITLGQVHEALSYYYNHPDEMRRYRREEEKALSALRDRTIKPPIEQ